MTKRDFIDLNGYSRTQITRLINDALKFKSRGYPRDKPLKERFVALLFQKPSTRTRVSFEVATGLLGGRSLYLGWNELQLGRGETIGDTARVLSRYVDAIVARVDRHQDLTVLALHSDKPVVNALSDLLHPCQALADAMTIAEEKGKLSSLRIAYVGDGNNVCNSLIEICGKLGLDLAVACPPGYRPNPIILKKASATAEKMKACIEVFSDPVKAVRQADVVYTDVFVSMGQESERPKRMRAFYPRYEVNRKLMAHAKPDAIFMHCLPAHRGEEVTDEIIDGNQSRVWQQAENRLHSEAALLRYLLPRRKGRTKR
ncbi:MAG: ornithine carbamoyltransferase [Aigarchaeota archaeon]|nr:ornithine carbamoyltransferase [Aigarchaeota archaeon]